MRLLPGAAAFVRSHYRKLERLRRAKTKIDSLHPVRIVRELCLQIEALASDSEEFREGEDLDSIMGLFRSPAVIDKDAASQSHKIGDGAQP